MADDLSEGDGPGARVVVASRTSFPDAAAALIARLLSEAAAAHPRAAVTLALSGGSTPGPVYERLATSRPSSVPWERLRIFFADERRVPPEDPESNYRLVHERLLAHAPEAPEAVHRMRGELEDGAAAAAEYEALLPERLDVLVLGIGEDGHTASLFPEHPALDRADRRVLAVRAPSPPHGRLTLTPNVIRAARERVVLARGSGKAVPVRRALEEPGPVREVPARLARVGHWVLDRDAASDLSTEPSPA